MAKFKNCFNSTVGLGDEIKSFLYTSDGTALTQSGGALDVNIASSDISINVAESDVYAEDSAHTSGDDGSFMLAVRRDARAVGSDTDGDYSSLNVNAVGELWVKDADVLAELQGGITVDDGGGSLTVDGTVAATQSGSWTVDVGNTVTVQATDLDIRQLLHTGGTPDSVQIGDGTEILQVNTDGSINTKAAKDTTIVSAQPTVGTSAAVLVATASDQTTITVRNEGDEAIFVGPSGVTTGTGFKIDCGEVYTFQVNADLYAIAASATSAGDLHTLQIAA